MSDVLLWLQGWDNVPFLLVLLIGLGLAGASLIGALGDGDAGHDPGADLGHDGHAHLSGLGWLGLGRAPLSVLLQTLLVTFGLCGLGVNAIAHDALGGGGPVGFGLALLVASAGAVLATRAVGAGFARVIPPEAEAAPTPDRFVGQIGVAASSITRSFGQIRVTPEGQIPALLNARLEAGGPEEIARGTEIHVVGYDAKRQLYRVARIPDLDGPPLAVVSSQQRNPEV